MRDVVVPYEQDPRRDSHGPTDALVHEMREKARAAGVLTPHILVRRRPSDPARDRARPAQVGAVDPGAARGQHRRARRGQYVPARQGRQPRDEGPLPEAARRGTLPQRLLHDRAGQRRWRRVRPVDDEDDVPDGRQSLGDQRQEALRDRRRRRAGRDRHGQVRRRRLHVRRRSARSRDRASPGCRIPSTARCPAAMPN